MLSWALFCLDRPPLWGNKGGLCRTTKFPWNARVHDFFLAVRSWRRTTVIHSKSLRRFCLAACLIKTISVVVVLTPLLAMLALFFFFWKWLDLQ